MKIKHIILLLPFCLLLALPAIAQKHKRQQKYSPRLLRKLYLGMSLEEFAQRRPQLPPNQIKRQDFRYVWRQNFPSQKEVESAHYYFDAESTKPLYEIILTYRDLEARQKWINKHLGPPNHDESDWRFESGEGFIIRIWLYENKLIFAGEIPGTEWGEEAGR